MYAILSATAPIYLVVAVGYLTTRRGMFSPTTIREMSKFVTQVALPCLIFLNLFDASPTDIANPTYLLTYFGAMATMMCLGLLYSRLRGQRAVRGAWTAMAFGGTNNGFVGFPLLLFVVPHVAALAVGMDMIVDNIFLVPTTLAMAEIFAQRGTGGDGFSAALRQVRAALLNVARNPMVIGLVLALFFSGFGWKLPEFAERAVTLFAQASSGIALFAVGGLLVGMNVRGVITDLVSISVAKLLLMPVVALGVLTLLVAVGLPEPDPALKAAAILTAGLPAPAMLASLTVPYREEEMGAGAVMLTTVLSFPTLSLWLAAVTAWGWV